MGLDHTRYIVFLASASRYLSENKSQRVGQGYYNAFRLMYPKLEDEIRNTEYDCFNNNNKLPGFLCWVQARLDSLDTTK